MTHDEVAVRANVLKDIQAFSQHEAWASLMWRLRGLGCEADVEAVHGTLKDPVGVRALAAEMAYRLSGIEAADILPWAASADRLGRPQTPGPGDGRHAGDPTSQVHDLLMRRDAFVERLGGIGAAREWARLYPTRAAAISAQQSLFLRSGREPRDITNSLPAR
jgi:hypothetical protein